MLEFAVQRIRTDTETLFRYQLIPSSDSPAFECPLLDKELLGWTGRVSLRYGEDGKYRGFYAENEFGSEKVLKLIKEKNDG